MWCFLFLLPFLQLSADLSALYLSWYGDPTSTMTIQWHSLPEEIGDTISLKSLDDGWHSVDGEHIEMDGILVHKVSLTNLDPGMEYSFRIGTDSKIYRFRTAPDQLNEPLRFVIGGDIYGSTKIFRRMCKTVVENDPLFAVLGGDIAYAINIHPFRSSALRRWVAFLRDWKDHMITPSGRIIPFLIVPGNHDIAPDNYELFFSLFAFPQKQLYRAVDFGSYLSLILLDTAHFQPIEGRQTLWLDKALSARTSIPYRFAVYHEAAYPSFKPYHGTIPKKIRTHWVPLFENYNLSAAFENHNHTYKKTYPIKDNQIDPDGIIYIGDGAWGVPSRKTNDLWYLAKRSRKNNVLLISLTEQEATIQAIDMLNAPFDTTIITPPNN